MLALMIGTIGENATLKRAFCYKVQRGMIHLAGYAHPSGSELNDIHFGKFGAIMAFRQYVQEEVDLNLLGKDLCQHIVGMNPKFLGSSEFEPADKNEDEESLLHQEYLLDETITVADFLSNNGIEVLDFKRFQCGELSSESGSR
ncbi:hypothetical protein HHI36_004836 [Cryptolaemus montrouzieri]|uniref:Translation elongation factor EFTs/EF1B dimerisation domain-containing protein n=1 Tax=Cryptolaemus montrouzieri TaxID=559131 RepID=A0ABD2NTX7_9CUCU